MGRPKGSKNKEKTQTQKIVSSLVEAVVKDDVEKVVEAKVSENRWVKIIYAGKHPITDEDVYIECKE
jgi:hypothetical protein